MTKPPTQAETPVWFSNCPMDVANYGAIECIESAENAKNWRAKILSGKRLRFEKKDIPLGLRDVSGRYGEKYARYMPDFVIAETSVIVVSKKMHDLLVQFDMGDNQLIEVPFFDVDGVTPRPERFWILAVATWKASIDEENTSIGPKKYFEDGKFHPLPNLLTRSDRADRFMFNQTVAEVGRGQIALPCSVVGGADLWSDPRIDDLLFFSDRLRCAIKGAKLKLKHMPFYRVVLTNT